MGLGCHRVFDIARMFLLRSNRESQNGRIRLAGTEPFFFSFFFLVIKRSDVQKFIFHPGLQWSISILLSMLRTPLESSIFSLLFK